MELSAGTIQALTAVVMAAMDDRLVARLESQEQRLMGFIGQAIDQRMDQRFQEMEARMEERLLSKLSGQEASTTASQASGSSTTASAAAAKKRRAASPDCTRRKAFEPAGSQVNDRRIWLVGFQKEMTAAALNRAMKWAMDQIGFLGTIECTSRGSSRSACCLCSSSGEASHVLELFRARNDPLLIGEMKVRITKDRSLEDRLRGRVYNHMWNGTANFLLARGIAKFELGTTGARGTLYATVGDSESTTTLWRLHEGEIVAESGWAELSVPDSEVKKLLEEIEQALAKPSRG